MDDRYRCIVGIDPGFSGGIAVILWEGGLGWVGNIPVVPGKKKASIEYDLSAMHRIVKSYLPQALCAIIEEPPAMPNQRCTSTARQFTGYGIWLGLLASLPLIRPKPALWKKSMGVNGEKANTISEANRLFPSWAGWESMMKTTHGRDLVSGQAEALLLAEYGRRLCVGSKQ